LVMGSGPSRPKSIGFAIFAAKITDPVGALTNILLPAVNEVTPAFVIVGCKGLVGVTVIPVPAVIPVKVPPLVRASRLIIPAEGVVMATVLPELWIVQGPTCVLRLFTTTRPFSRLTSFAKGVLIVMVASLLVMLTAPVCPFRLVTPEPPPPPL